LNVLCASLESGLRIQEPIPTGLFIRCFSKDEYAESFFNGNIRAGWLTKYKDMEGDVRVDTTEGESIFTDNINDMYYLRFHI